MTPSYSFGVLSRSKRRKEKPYRIEHRAVDETLVQECKEWGEWGTLGRYATPGDRDKALAEIQKDASGRWEYRTADDPSAEKCSV